MFRCACPARVIACSPAPWAPRDRATWWPTPRRTHFSSSTPAGPWPPATPPRSSCSAASWRTTVRHSSATKPARRALSHLDARGRARMVDVSAKEVTVREAVARGRIRIAPAAMRLVRAGRLKKGGVVEVARIAGLLAAKRTAEAIPLCHPIGLTHADVELHPRRDGFEIEARVRTLARTGAEME